MVDAIRYHHEVKKLNSDAEWQQALTVAGYPLEVDGIWGPLSKSALVEFQRDQGDLVVDGIRGPLTEAALLTC
jgi:peptidoglycan hydrolase-like protein with peptidoglycan-binding domain